MALKEAVREKAAAGVDGDVAGASARERILDEAQRVFAGFGYDGASLRQIAEAAGVPVALASYHFGSKDGLYRAVFYRRVPAIVEQRLAGLAIAMSESNLDRRLELVVKALVMPLLHLRARDKDPSLGRLLAHESTDPNSEARGIIRDLFDPVAHKLLEALSSALPGRSARDVYWAYDFMLGALVHVMADSGRIVRLSKGRCRPDDEATAVAHMVAFLTAGIRFGTPVAGSASVASDDDRTANRKKSEGRRPAASGRISRRQQPRRRSRRGV